QLQEPDSRRVVATGWLRRLKSSGSVIYAGLYSTLQIPEEENPCVKVTFPLPRQRQCLSAADCAPRRIVRAGFFRWRVRTFRILSAGRLRAGPLEGAEFLDAARTVPCIPRR